MNRSLAVCILCICAIKSGCSPALMSIYPGVVCFCACLSYSFGWSTEVLCGAALIGGGGGIGENDCSPANPANQFCLISHCTLSPTSPPTEGRDSVILCLSAAEGKRRWDLPHRDKLTLHCHLSCQSVDRRSYRLTIVFTFSCLVTDVC